MEYRVVSEVGHSAYSIVFPFCRTVSDQDCIHWLEMGSALVYGNVVIFYIQDAPMVVSGQLALPRAS